VKQKLYSHIKFEIKKFLYYIFVHVYYICIENLFSHGFNTNLIVTSAVVLNGPVLRSWMLLASLMWSSILQLRAVTQPAFAVLLQFPLRRAT
jgi:hypothetical protein